MYLISYDVSKKRISKFSKLLEQYGKRIQNSVFLIEDHTSFQEVKTIINEIRNKEDNILMLQVKEILNSELSNLIKNYYFV